MQKQTLASRLHIFLLFFVCGCTFKLFTQEKPDPAARFTFNNKSSGDEFSDHHAKLVGSRFTYDRFGNADNAVYLFGNVYSYINLGNYKALKPDVGSVSLWFCLYSDVWSGKGYTINPIILTKNSERDDFYESYSVHYVPGFNALVSNISQDSLHQVVLPGLKRVNLVEWHHVALSFNYDSVSFYIDGELQTRQRKRFATSYNPRDSVLVGVPANKKNNRFMMGIVDDIAFYDRVLSDAEIKELYEAPNPNKYKLILKEGLTVLGIVAVLVLVYLLARYSIGKAQKKQRERLELQNRLLETELRMNRALMNPHFVYNSLYSIQSLILNREIEQANDYLVRFSRLLRKTLENNVSDSISLEAEIELLNRFLEVESLKFENGIRHTIRLQNIPAPSSVQIPVLMIQPFVENAVLHGLQDKEGEKWIGISFELRDRYLACTIEDNGTGRRAKENKPGKKPMAIQLTKTRLELLNRIHQLQCSLEIEDRPENQGTIVKLLLPATLR